MKLYVGNLSFETSSTELQSMFAQTGTVESVSLIEDRETGRSRGFGFVEMNSKTEANAAKEKFDGQDLHGRALKVDEAKEAIAGNNALANTSTWETPLTVEMRSGRNRLLEADRHYQAKESRRR